MIKLIKVVVSTKHDTWLGWKPTTLIIQAWTVQNWVWWKSPKGAPNSIWVWISQSLVRKSICASSPKPLLHLQVLSKWVLWIWSEYVPCGILICFSDNYYWIIFLQLIYKHSILCSNHRRIALKYFLLSYLLILCTRNQNLHHPCRIVPTQRVQ